MTTLNAAELDLENLLLRLPHVLGVRVEMSDRGMVRRIHVVANRRARPERLAAEVERTLEEGRSLRLDPEVVSVVVLGARNHVAPSGDGLELTAVPAETTAAPIRRGVEPRVELRRLSFERAGELRIRATVELKLNEIIFTGELWEADVASARPVLAARAVLKALEFLREKGAVFYLDTLEFLDCFQAPVALAVVQAISAREKRALSGCALVTRSREDAAARASLAAINRFYAALLPRDAPLPARNPGRRPR